MVQVRKACVVIDCERSFFEHAFKTNDQGRLLYPEQLYSCPKKM